MIDRYGFDVLQRKAAAPLPEIEARVGLVVECATSGYCGALVRTEKTAEGWAVVLEDRRGRQRLFPNRPGAFLLEGRPVALKMRAAGPQRPARSASGSVLVTEHRARVARASRIWVEGLHDAELIERVWGHDLRVEGIVVEPLHGADRLCDALAEFEPGPQRRVGVLLDHLTPGSKESRLAAQAAQQFAGVLVVGHPFVDVWQAVKPAVLGIRAWPEIPPGQSWKVGVIDALGWRLTEAEAWRRILGRVRTYADLEPALLARVEELIDFVSEA